MLFYKKTNKDSKNIKVQDIKDADLICFPENEYSSEKATFIANYLEFKGNVHLSARKTMWNVYREAMVETAPTVIPAGLEDALAKAGL